MKVSQNKKMRMSKKTIFLGLFVIIGIVVLGFNQLSATAAPADSIVGFVWQDLDADGIRDAGEPGLGNVTVNLLDDGGSPLASATTFPTGDYIFSSLTTPDDYIIEFEIPSGSGFVFSPQGQGSDPLKDSDADIGSGQTALISLSDGEGRDGISAGMHPPTTIGDRVWNDLNVNGIQDGGEPGLGGVDVELYTSVDAFVASTTTIFNGSYTFVGMPPGQYYVKFILPAGFTFSPQGQGVAGADSDADVITGETAVFTVTVGTSKDDIDAGLFQPATIGNRIWEDLNSDGIQDGGEPGIAGIAVTLYDTTDAEIDDTTTDPSGIYTFTNLIPDTYYLIFEIPTGYFVTPQDQSADDVDSDIDATGRTANVTVVFGENQQDMDAGYYRPSTIGDFVWNDLNGDGNQDGGEPGIDGVTIQLFQDVAPIGVLDGSDIPLGSPVTTAGGGAYDFTDLPAGDYIVNVTDTNNLLIDFALTGGIDPQFVTITTNQDFNDADFGFQEQTGSVGDFVWNDLDGDGLQDGGGEVGIDGISVQLYQDVAPIGTLDGSDVPVGGPVVTAGGGAYDFTGLPAGTYVVDVDEASAPLTGFVLTGGTDPLFINLANDQDYNAADFGFQQNNASIGDFVWNDLDGDGVQDGGEPGLDGVTIDLYHDADGSGTINGGDTVINTTTTAGGAYDFVNLTADAYLVDVTDTGAVLTGFGLTGGTDPHAITITAGQDYNAADFGFQQQNASIGNFVWNDVNDNGTPDGLEVGIDGVAIQLYRDVAPIGTLDGSDVPLGPPIVTAGGGAYDFTNLAAGTYIVDVDGASAPLAGFTLTTANDPLPVTITPGQDFNDADFGFRDSATASIGDFVWNDLNGNGVQDGGPEAGIDGVAVQLYQDVAPIGTLDGSDVPIGPPVLTAGGGAYDFTSLVAGTYIVDIDEASAPLTNFALTGGTDPHFVNIGPAQDYNGADFGFQQQNASIGDFVWYDLDGDGVQDGGSEVGIDGVSVQLYRDVAPIGTLTGSDVPLGAPIVTAGGGAYDFTNLAAGTYLVDVNGASAPLTGFVLTGGTNPHAVAVAAGEDYNSADFGFQEHTASIGNFVWNDLNGNGMQDGGAEVGIDGVTLDLYDDVDGSGTINGGDVVIDTTTTAGGGNYDFTGLALGDYIVDVTDTNGILTGLNLTTFNDPQAVIIVVGEDFNGANFGYQDPGNASIGDFVWNDLNGNGTQDGGSEVGIDGVTLDLYRDVDGSGTINGSDVVISTTTTAGGGAYDFINLVGDDYLVDVTDTGGVLTGWSLTGGTDPHVVTLSLSQDYNGADFGYRDPSDATIGDLIWNDRDGNGVQDAGEPGLDGITVNLTGFGPDDTFGTGDDVVYPAQVTAGGGAYDFTGLPVGMYRVDVSNASLPGGVSLTGGIDPLDVTLGVSEDYNDADFGYQGNASIGDLVWLDDNGNGVQDGGESGLAGVTIYIDLNNNSTRDNDEPFGTTNATGNYAISGLPAGTYAVNVDGSTAPTDSTLNTATPMSVNLTSGQSFVDADFAFVESFEVYLPIILNNVETIVAPDLVVTSVSATNDEVQVVIRNQGNIATSTGFWVDFYVNPSEAPTHANQLWDDLATEGIAWGITDSVAAGAELTLTYSTDPNAPNLYYSAADSNFSGTLTAGTPVYAQVDSAHLGNVNGAVLETHEISGGAYNNVSDEVLAADAPTTAPNVSSVLNMIAPVAAKFGLPSR